MQCDCGATDCRSCGPAQGHEVVRVPGPGGRGWRWINVDSEAEEREIRAALADEAIDRAIAAREAAYG
jgi:hypothetical protein